MTQRSQLTLNLRCRNRAVEKLDDKFSTFNYILINSHRKALRFIYLKCTFCLWFQSKQGRSNDPKGPKLIITVIKWSHHTLNILKTHTQNLVQKCQDKQCWPRSYHSGKTVCSLSRFFEAPPNAFVKINLREHASTKGWGVGNFRTLSVLRVKRN